MYFQATAFGQETSCSSKLEQAREKYNAGIVQDVPGLLEGCITSGFTGEERLQAYKLLINAYIFDDNLRQAETTMLVFLKTFPGYKASSDDTPEFTSLLNQYDNRPRGSFGFFAGTNFSLVRVKETFGVQNLNSISGNYRSHGPSFQAGFTYHVFIHPKIELGLEPVFTGTRYGYEVTPYPFTDIKYEESQTRIELPVTLTYCFTGKKLSPYLLAGGSVSMLLSAKGNISRSFHNTGDYRFSTLAADNMTITDQRNGAELKALVGGGLRFAMKRSYVYIDMRYIAGLGSQVKAGSRNNPADENTWRYYYIPDDFSLDNLSLRIGLAKTLYHPRHK